LTNKSGGKAGAEAVNLNAQRERRLLSIQRGQVRRQLEVIDDPGTETLSGVVMVPKPEDRLVSRMVPTRQSMRTPESYVVEIKHT
jgi:hypothetical protein